MMNQRINNTKIIEIATFIVLVATYIIPTGLFNTKYQISKFFFVCFILLLYILYCGLNNRINKKELLLILILIIAAIVSNNTNFLVFITLPFADLLIQYKDKIIRYLKKSNILYICVIFTVFYSVVCFLYLPTPGNEKHTNLVRAAIIEKNQSGLSIFCLGLMLMKKNRHISNAVFAMGLFTESRSYFLSILIYLFSQTKLARSIVKKFGIEKWTYLKITLITNLLLLLLGFIYIELYQRSLIIPYSKDNSFFSLNDYSNFFRFSLIVLFCYVLLNNPKYIGIGLTDIEYRFQLNKAASNIFGIPYGGNQPHNLFFSHLQKYGVFSLIEVYYVSIILKKIVTRNNFYVYISIILYSILLGAGMYSYWLYLSIFVLIMQM